MKRSKFACILLSIVLVAVMLPTSVVSSASSGTIYESEYNGSYTYATRTYDDYDNRGTISGASDVDWWTITFSQEGIANFWLGGIPSGCDYDLQVYDYTGTKLLVESLKGSNSQELTKIHVRAGEDYFIRIFSNSGYSSTPYKFRVKRYDLQQSALFTQNITNNTYPTQAAALPYLNLMGFTTKCFLNSTATVAFNTMPTADIMTVRSHGGAGLIQIDKSASYSSYIYGLSFPSMESGCKAISDYSYGELTNTKLVIYSACEAGKTSQTYGNLVDETLNKGAFCCIGWVQITRTADGNKWVPKFLEYCSLGHNVGNARRLANQWAMNSGEIKDASSILDQYVGASREFATLLG